MQSNTQPVEIPQRHMLGNIFPTGNKPLGGRLRLPALLYQPAYAPGKPAARARHAVLAIPQIPGRHRHGAGHGLVKANRIDVLIDVRLYNNTQLAGFSKTRDLEHFLAELCGCGLCLGEAVRAQPCAVQRLQKRTD